MKIALRFHQVSVCTFYTNDDHFFVLILMVGSSCCVLRGKNEIMHIDEICNKTYCWIHRKNIFIWFRFKGLSQKITIKQCAELICFNPKYATRMGRNRPITEHNDFLLA